MKKIILTGLLGLLLNAPLWAQKNKEYVITGKIENQGNAKVLLAYADKNSANGMHIDSAVAADGVFTLQGTIAEPILAYFLTKIRSKNMNMQQLILSPTRIQISGDAKNLDQAKLSDDFYNAPFNRYKKLSEKPDLVSARLDQYYRLAKKAKDTLLVKKYTDSIKVADEQKDQIRKQFIAANPKAWITPYIMQAYLASTPLEILEPMYLKLDKSIQQTAYGKVIADKISGLKATQTGQQAISFIKTDKEGNTIDLGKYKGKYVLLDFWGSWCGPCRASHPHLKALYQQYKDKGFEILGIAYENGASLTEQKKSWLKAITEDALPWTQLLNNEGAEKQDIVKLYGISAFPTKILLDKEGKILARYTGDGTEIDGKLAELMK
jgi:thiol-disulfide isomerase/thioredoxin/plasmid maintenance system killer protein